MAKRRRVLDEAPKSPTSKVDVSRFVGLIPADDLALMKEAIESDCEQLDEPDSDAKGR